MSWLLIVGLKNAIVVVPLAVAALAAGRCFRRPALAHVLWVLVLVKLLTPPLVDVPVGWSLDVSPWLAEQPRPAELAALPPSLPVASTQPASIQSMPLAAENAAVCEAPPQAAPGATADPVVATAPLVCPNDHTASSLPAWLALPRWASLPPTRAAWLAIAGCLWLCGSALAAAVLLRRAMHFHRFLRLAARSDHRLAGRVQQLARAVGLKSSPQVIVVEGVVSPMLWGLGNRVQLVFPARLAERLSPAEVDALLLHELAHYARGDYWVRLVELLAHVAFWWHPVVWWARREIEAAEEQCCDAWVVEHQSGTRLAYAEALLATIDFLCEPAAALPPAACGLGDVPLLRIRLTQIMRGELAGRLPRTVWVGVLCAGLLLSPLEPAVFATSTRERADTPRPLPAPRLISTAQGSDLPTPPVEPAADQASTETSATSPVAPSSPPAIVPPAEQRPISIVFATAESPNGAYRLEAGTGRETTLLHAGLPQGRLGLSSNRITCAAFAPDSRTFVTGHEDGLLRQWDSDAGERLITLRVHSGPIVSVAVSPSGTHVAAGAADGSIGVWDLASQSEVARLANPDIAVSCLRWSPDGSRLAVALGSWTTPDDARLLIWSPASGQALAEHSLLAPLGAIDWLSADLLLLADWQGGATVRNLAGQSIGPSLQLEKNVVSAAHWSPDCRLITPWDAQQLLTGTAR